MGLNATRALSLRHGIPDTGTLSVGRVQTSTLALIAHRDQRIADFRPEAFARVRATCVLADGSTYPAIWQPAAPPDPDHPDRVPADAARAVAVRIPPGTPGQVSTVDTQTVTLRPPLRFNLSDLQREANQRFGLAAQETLDAAQWLYQHQATSSPRTSARHVTAAVPGTLASRLQRLARAGPHQSSVLGWPHPLPVARITDDAAVAHAGHYAILPTGEPPPDDATDPHQQVYDLIGRRVLAALSPAARTSAPWRRRSSAESASFRGAWRSSCPVGGPSWPRPPPRAPPPDDEEKDAAGRPVTVARTEARAGQTQPPPRLSDASRLARIKKHGLGTSATRARVLEVLARRGYIARKQRALMPALVDAVGEAVAGHLATS